ncbi:MAG: sigma-70 family RNA polymerase sigma factor [Pseudomonadota bacterium]|nr:sigma-70 family RNA polymerase sigma factor [Pseudomonadota bacterium]
MHPPQPAPRVILILLPAMNREAAMHEETTPAEHDAARDALLAALIARMAAGHEVEREAALGEFYDATLGKVYGLALRISGRADAAEDVAAEVYHQAWRQAGRYDATRGRPLTWLLTMTHSRALDSLRRRDPAQSHPEPETLAEPQADPRADPLDLLLGVERDSAVHAALQRAPAIQRQLLALAFYRDLSHQEIADHTGMPLGTVKTHIRKGLLALQVALTGGKESL